MNRVRAAFSRRSTGVVLAIAAPLLFLLALGTWALASPAGSSPDDDFHVASIWCAQGDRPGLCESSTTPESREVPNGLIKAPFCFVFKSDQSAACQGISSNDLAATGMMRTERGNFAGLYPPVFYATLSVFAGNDFDDSVLLMRAFNAFLYVGLLTAVVVAVPRRLRRPAVVGAVATAVPLGMFIVPSTNPSSWALLCAATLWVSLLGFYESRGRRAAVLAGLSVLAILIGAGARADAAVFGVFAVGLVGILTIGRVRATIARVVLPVAITIIAVALYLTASQGSQIGDGLDNAARSSLPGLQLLLVDLQEVPQFWVGMLGQWGLGWLDTPMVAATWVVSSAVFFALVFWGLGAIGVRKATAFVGAFLALWVVPAVMLVQSGAIVGQVVQPRYILPLGVIVAGVAALPVPRRPELRLSPMQAGVVVLGLTVANSLALRSTIRRFVTGNDLQGWNLSHGAEWWWGVGPSPTMTWLLGSAAFGLALVALALLDARERRTTDEGRPVAHGDVATDVGPSRPGRKSLEPQHEPTTIDEAAGTGVRRPVPSRDAVAETGTEENPHAAEAVQAERERL